MEDEQEEVGLTAEELEMKREMLDALAQSILATRDEAVSHRAALGVEIRWRDDEKMLEGEDPTDVSTSMLDTATGKATIANDNRSKAWINITRGRCETAFGRFCETLLPTNGKNWGLKDTPIPELAKVSSDKRPAMQASGPVTHEDGTQATMGDVAIEVQSESEKKMGKMSLVIEDQLAECKYNAIQRKGIRSAIHLGTMVIKGPVVVKDIKKSWQEMEGESKTIHVLKMIEELAPTSKHISPWNCFPSPDCEDDARKASFMWERDTMLPREIRKLIGVPGYDEDQIARILQEEPKRTTAAGDSESGYKTIQDSVSKGSAYETWEYNGDVEREVLEALGCDCEDLGSSISACIVFINDRQVKAELNPVDTGDLPYDFFQWIEVSGSPWGIGIPRQMAWLQRIMVGAWRAMLENAGDSAGANIIVNSNVVPMDGRFELVGKKLWRMINPDDDVRQAFAQFQVKNNQAELEKLIDLVLRFVDLETSTPTLFQGEAQKQPETLGVANIVVDSSNITFRQRIALYDDKITDPHITRYYDYNMQHHDDPEIKGDYKVDPVGVRILFERDQMAQILGQVMGMQENPTIERMVSWDKAIEKFFKARNIDDILKTENELEEYDAKKKEQPQQSNPQADVANIRVKGEMAKEELRQDSDMSELQFKAEQANLERVHDKELKQMEYNMKLMEFAEKRGIGLDKLKVQLALNAKAKGEGVVPEVAKPIVEPEGQAPAGHAYEM